MLMKRQLFLAGISLILGGMPMLAQDISSVNSVSYEWKSVPIVGGGFVDGIVFHPEAPGVRYCRTDMGGAYRWDAASNQWTPLLDWISLDESNLQGVESIAIDPQNPQNVYIACGTYTSSSNGAILCSYDGGRTFARIDVPFTMGGNENGRGNGERMMVDPQNGNIIYMGTRLTRRRSPRRSAAPKSSRAGHGWCLSRMSPRSSILPTVLHGGIAVVALSA